MLARLDDTRSDARQVKGSHRHNQEKTLQVFGCGEFAGLELEATRFLVKKGFFDVKTQAVLVQGPGMSGFVARDKPGIIGMVKGPGQSQVDWSNGSSEKRHLVEELDVADRRTQIPDSRDRLVRQMDQGVAHQPQANVPVLLVDVVQQVLMDKAAKGLAG